MRSQAFNLSTVLLMSDHLLHLEKVNANLNAKRCNNKERLCCGSFKWLATIQAII